MYGRSTKDDNDLDDGKNMYDKLLFLLLPVTLFTWLAHGIVVFVLKRDGHHQMCITNSNALYAYTPLNSSLDCFEYDEFNEQINACTQTSTTDAAMEELDGFLFLGLMFFLYATYSFYGVVQWPLFYDSVLRDQTFIKSMLWTFASYCEYVIIYALVGERNKFFYLFLFNMVFTEVVAVAVAPYWMVAFDRFVRSSIINGTNPTGTRKSRRVNPDSFDDNLAKEQASLKKIVFETDLKENIKKVPVRAAARSAVHYVMHLLAIMSFTFNWAYIIVHVDGTAARSGTQFPPLILSAIIVVGVFKAATLVSHLMAVDYYMSRTQNEAFFFISTAVTSLTLWWCVHQGIFNTNGAVFGNCVASL